MLFVNRLELLTHDFAGEPIDRNVQPVTLSPSTTKFAVPVAVAG
jgi:hypothetical protein